MPKTNHKSSKKKPHHQWADLRRMNAAYVLRHLRGKFSREKLQSLSAQQTCRTSCFVNILARVRDCVALNLKGEFALPLFRFAS